MIKIEIIMNLLKYIKCHVLNLFKIKQCIFKKYMNFERQKKQHQKQQIKINKIISNIRIQKI